jgi:hypothetical protein
MPIFIQNVSADENWGGNVTGVFMDGDSADHE